VKVYGFSVVGRYGNRSRLDRHGATCSRSCVRDRRLGAADRRRYEVPSVVVLLLLVLIAFPSSAFGIAPVILGENGVAGSLDTGFSPFGFPALRYGSLHGEGGTINTAAGTPSAPSFPVNGHAIPSVVPTPDLGAPGYVGASSVGRITGFGKDAAGVLLEPWKGQSAVAFPNVSSVSGVDRKGAASYSITSSKWTWSNPPALTASPYHSHPAPQVFETSYVTEMGSAIAQSSGSVTVAKRLNDGTYLVRRVDTYMVGGGFRDLACSWETTALVASASLARQAVGDTTATVSQPAYWIYTGTGTAPSAAAARWEYRTSWAKGASALSTAQAAYFSTVDLTNNLDPWRAGSVASTDTPFPTTNGQARSFIPSGSVDLTSSAQVANSPGGVEDAVRSAVDGSSSMLSGLSGLFWVFDWLNWEGGS